MQKQAVQINFSQGLNTKTDEWQVPIGQFENLENSIFQKGGLLQKAPGYGLLTSSNPESSYITTLNDNLTSIGTTVNAYSESLNSWISKGSLSPCSLSVLPLIRNNLNQIQNDTAISNNLVITTWTQTYDTVSAVVTQHLYAIADVNTGQNIVEPTLITPIAAASVSGSSRVFVVGNYFVIVSQVLISSTSYLQYLAIPINNPSNPMTPQNVVSEAYVPITSNPGWDGVSINNASENILLIAYNSTATAQGVHVATLTVGQIAANQETSTIKQFNNAAYIGALVSVCVDVTPTLPVFYISFWNNSTSNGYIVAVTVGVGSITQVFAPTEIISDVSTANLASAAQNGSCLVFNEVVNTYSFDDTVATDYIVGVAVTSGGSVGSPSTIVRSVGLASKAFIINGDVYFLSSFSSTYQPSYFLINGSTSTEAAPVIVAKLAYQNGGGYCALGLPSVNVDSATASISYLYKDDVEALNTLDNPQQTTAGGIYSQTGINLCNFEIGSKSITTSEIANNLHISGGYLSQYDGYLPVEHNFFLFPEPVECTYTEVSTVTPTGTASNGSFTIVVSSATGISPGMTIADSTNSTYIPANTIVTLVNGTTLTMSQKATHAISGDTLSIQGNIAAVPSGGTEGAVNYYYQATYEWTDNQGLPYRSAPSIPVAITTAGTGTTGSILINVPTLRLTLKVSNPVKIVIYRWSENTEVYNQVTSITAPLLNSTTVDQVSFTDNLPDADIVGNNTLYTTGGVVADANAPATNLMTLFNSSLCLVPAENPNTVWIGKQVVQGTPVEMSTGLSIYVSPTQGTAGSLGDITALAPMDDKLVMFFKNGAYYINGQPPPVTGLTAVGCSLGNYSQPTFITSTVGCTNQASIALIPTGLMFQSDKGIYLQPRDLSPPQYIGAQVEEFNDYQINSAQVIPGTNYILFTLSGVSTFLMYDWYYNQWGTFDGNSVVSSCIYQNLHTILDEYGRILQSTPDAYLNASTPVLMSFTTGWINLASLQGYQRLYDFYLLAKFLSPHSLNIGVAYDYNPTIVHQTLITPQNFSSSEPSGFGVPVPFGAPANKEQWRIHAKQQLCESFQITVTEVFNPAYTTTPGAGFTMSGILARIGIKSSTKPIPGISSSGLTNN